MCVFLYRLLIFVPMRTTNEIGPPSPNLILNLIQITLSLPKIRDLGNCLRENCHSVLFQKVTEKLQDSKLQHIQSVRIDILNYSSETQLCPICSSTKLVFNPLEPFSSLCCECDMELDRCCFTFQLISTELQNVHSCPSCKVVGIANSYQYVTKNESILFDEEFELDNSIGIGCSNNILCPFCSVMMLPL